MHDEGAWMTSAPLARAVLRSRFMRGAISPTRPTAFLQWCRSHMSQTITAVALASQSTFCCRTAQSPAASRVRLRVSRVKVPALADARDKSKRKLTRRFMALMTTSDGMLPAWPSVVNQNTLRRKLGFAKVARRFSLAKRSGS